MSPYQRRPAMFLGGRHFAFHTKQQPVKNGLSSESVRRSEQWAHDPLHVPRHVRCRLAGKSHCSITGKPCTHEASGNAKKETEHKTASLIFKLNPTRLGLNPLSPCVCTSGCKLPLLAGDCGNTPEGPPWSKLSFALLGRQAKVDQVFPPGAGPTQRRV